MSNPSFSTHNITDTASLIFEGCGQVEVRFVSVTPSTSAVYVGGANIDVGASPQVETWDSIQAGSVFAHTFKADGALYARCSTGATAVLKIVRWF